jgi:hypothetical protein
MCVISACWEPEETESNNLADILDDVECEYLAIPGVSLSHIPRRMCANIQKIAERDPGRQRRSLSLDHCKPRKELRRHAV